MQTIAFLLAIHALQPADAPAPLKPWVEWVLHGQEWVQCAPVSLDAGEEGEAGRRCVWPSTLELDLVAKNGSFTQRFVLDAPALVALPGNASHWPLDVKVDGQLGMVSDRDGTPRVELKAGEHTVNGRFAWDTLPEALEVPSSTGLVRLKVNGKPVPLAEREASTLYLRAEADEAREEREDDSLALDVHRRVVDDVPLRVLTRVELLVSGKNREVVIGPALLEGFVPMSLVSPLPARIESNGTLRVQVRPGKWVIELDARHPQNPNELGPGPVSETWVAQEIWVFEALPPLRVVDVEGAETVDPQQTTLPTPWKRLPAYALHPAEKLRLVEKQRGESSPQPDRLRLVRDIWLDFDGGGYTVRDAITGDRHMPGRLEMDEALELGRVSIDGADQFITKVKRDGTERSGIELKRGPVRLSADSRLPSATRSFPIVGWTADMSTLGASLHLPPGWRLFTVSGADDVPGSWFRRWSLLELFLVLVATFGFARLFGTRTGVIACVALVFSVPEPGAPAYTWLVLLAIETLVRVVPLARLVWWLRVARVLAWVVLALTLAEFSLREVRTAMYPTLEHEWSGLGTSNDAPKAVVAEPELDASAAMGAMSAPSPEAVMDERDDEGGGGPGGAPAKELMRKRKGAPEQNAANRIQRKAAQSSFNYSQNNYQADPKIVVQTGPGLPSWNWNTYEIRFSGVVTQEQRVRFFLVSPWLSGALGFLRVGLVALLFAIAVAAPLGRLPRRISRGLGFVAMLLLLTPSVARAQALPSQDMLEELKHRLSAPPRCAPHCVAISRMLLEVQNNTLRLRLEVSAAAKTSVPLPASEAQWMPQHVTLDGKEGAGLARDDEGALWLRVPAGAHQVVLEGRLPERQTVLVPLPLAPHFVEAKLSGWQLDGLHEDGQVDDNLQLSRDETREVSKSQALQQGALPPFVTVTRKLELGLVWQMETTIRRQTPLGSAVVLELPLLEGESVTSSEVRVEAGKVLVNMAPSQSELSWRSALRERAEIVLKARSEVSWSEVWQLDASPLWHVEVKGFPQVHGDGGALPEWRPWPNEELRLGVTRPEGAKGQTLTIDASSLEVRPGARATEATLRLVMRSSRGGQHTLRLARDASVQSVSINGQPQPLRASDGQLTLAIAPGAQTVEIVWRENTGTGFVTRTPAVDLGVASVNAEIKLAVPSERWLLLAFGDGAGPAILFWGTLMVLLLASLGLGRFDATPLRARHWFLLGLGLTQLDFSAAVTVFGWFLVLAARRRYGAGVSGIRFDAMQLVLVAWTIAAAIALFSAIRHGLVVQPDMQVQGNDSSDALLRFFSDRAGGALPRAAFVSVPLFVYRALMLLWALWLARALLLWVRWAWACLSEGGLWKPWSLFKRA